MKKHNVTIIVPVYNVEQYLQKCINSIIAQKYIFWKLILVNDGSTDNCPAICDSYAAIDERIVVIHKQNGGLSSARNVALDILDTKYVTFVDSDDYLHPDCLEDCLSIIKSHNADIVQFKYIKGDDDYYFENNNICKSKIFDFEKNKIFGSRFEKVGVWGKIYKSKLWEGIRMPIGRLNEDDATTWKLYYRASKVSAVDTQYYYYRVNPHSIMANLKKKPNIDFPILAYHERINFFETKGENQLSKLSKWRYSKYLMWALGDSRYSKEQRLILRSEFRKIWTSVFLCGSVPLSHKLLILITAICSRFTFYIIEYSKKK